VWVRSFDDRRYLRPYGCSLCSWTTRVEEVIGLSQR